MARDVEISLRVPNMKVRALDKTGQSIDHASMRFKKMVTLPAMPKLGETLSCQFGNRGITPEEYGDLVNDPDWALKPLVE
jgi:hypothetical protein